MKKSLYYYCISLLLFTLSCGDQDKTIIKNVYEGVDGKAVYYDTDETEGNLFISHTLYFYTILDKTEDNTWIIVEQEPLIAEEGRVETELQLYNIPEAKQVFLEDIDPNWSLYGSTFVKKAGKDCLMIASKEGDEEIAVPLDELLEKAKSAKSGAGEQQPAEETEQVPEPEHVSEIETGEVVTLEFGTEENQIGQGMAEKRLEGGRSLDAVPSFAAYKNQLYIIDAINFRVLVYDYSGNFARSISYFEKSEDGSVNVVRDICVDEGVLYLAAVYSNVVYVEDSETEDIIEIITGSDTEKGKFGYVDMITLDNEKNLIISDFEYNIYYVYKKDADGIHLLRSTPYSKKDQFVFDNEGNNYSIVSEGQEATLSDSQGNIITSFMYKSPVGSSEIIDIDDNNNIYVLTNEEEAPGAQFSAASFLKVIQPDGTIVDDIQVLSWPGGPMTKYIVVDGAGNVFVGSFDFEGSEDEPPSGFSITKKR
jgi:hypothetical protein